MIVLKPGEDVPVVSDNRPESTQRLGSANRISRDGPRIKRKSSENKVNLTNGEKNTIYQVTNSEMKLRAPLDLTIKFLNAIMEKDLSLAQVLCNEILKIEPNNSTCQEFRDVLVQALDKDDTSSNENEDGESSSADSDDSDFHEYDDNTIEEVTDDTESSDEDDDKSDDDDDGDDDELTADEIKNLNLLMGGLRISKIS